MNTETESDGGGSWLTWIIYLAAVGMVLLAFWYDASHAHSSQASPPRTAAASHAAKS